MHMSAKMYSAIAAMVFMTMASMNVEGFASPSVTAMRSCRATRLSVASSVEESSSSIPESNEEKAAPAPAASNQKDYGGSLPLPSTYVRCSKCQAHFALQPEDLGEKGKGRRVECSLCKHSWFQARDRLMDLRDGFELQPLDEHQMELVEGNLAAGRPASFAGLAKIYVGNLDFACEESDLVEAFKDCGDVGEVSLVRDHVTGRSRGFAFLTMMTKEGGDKAIEMMDGKDVMGRNLTVKRPNN